MFGYVVKAIHLLFVLFVILTPFFGNEILLTYHMVLVPFVMLHWLTNNDTCALTLFESKLTGLDENDTFTGRIIKPIYNAHIQSKYYYLLLSFLLLVTFYKLWSQGFVYLGLVFTTLMGTFQQILNQLNKA